MLFEAWSGPDGWREGREAFANELNPSQMCIQVKDVYKKNSFVLVLFLTVTTVATHGLLYYNVVLCACRSHDKV